MGVEHIDSAPDGPVSGPGANDAPRLRNRIEKIDQEIDRLRNSDGDLPSDLPSSVGVFADRDFYGREEIETTETVTEVEADLSAYRAGSWRPVDEDDAPNASDDFDLAAAQDEVALPLPRRISNDR